MTDISHDPQAFAAIAQLGSTVAKLGHHLDTVSKRVDALATEVTAPATTTTLPQGFTVTAATFRWRNLTEAQQKTAWTILLDWTWWLVRRYKLDDDLLPCWPAHPALVEELSALCVAWHQVYSDDPANTTPVWWHEAFHRARPRWAAWTQNDKCYTAGPHRGEHLPDTPIRPWPSSWRHDVEALVETPSARDGVA